MFKSADKARYKFNIMKTAIVISILMLSTIYSSAQVTLNEEPGVTRIMQLFKSNNVQKTMIRAWRIQIIATTDRSQMDAANRKFERLYPQIDYNWQHNPPYYQVQVGAYEKKEDLEAFLLQLKRDFPSAVPIQDDIKKTDLLDN